jgi:hypothetical protein
MKRSFWFVAGAVSGVYGMVKVRRTLENFTPDGVGARVAAARAGARMFADEVSAGMHEREADLLAELRASSVERRELDTGRAAASAPTPSPPHTSREGSIDGNR